MGLSWFKLFDRDGPLGHKRPASTLLFVFFFEGDFSIHCHSADEEGVPALPGPLIARGRTIGALRAVGQI